MLSKKENEILTEIKKGNNVLIVGEGGTGKTFFLRYLFNYLKEEYCKNVVLTATTGVAASNVGGTTLHSFAGIGLGDDDRDTLLKRVKNNKKSYEKWNETQILLLDEVSMLGASLFEKVNYIAQRVRQSTKPFGGIQLVLCGDFLQLPPVNDNYFFECSDYNSLGIKMIELDEKKRFTDQIYSDLLSRVRKGRPTEKDIERLKEREKEYNKIKDQICKWEIRPTVLHCKKVDVDYENKLELSKIDEDEYKFYATDSSKGTNEVYISYMLKQLDNLIPKKISLKKGAQVMLRYNLDVENHLVNGSRGVVVDMNDEAIIVKVKFSTGVIVDIGQHLWELKDKKAKVRVSREQIPLILAWGITVHKSQGITLDLAICGLNDVFEYGQAYVALSRLRSLNGLYLTGFDEMCIKANPKAVKFLEK